MYMFCLLSPDPYFVVTESESVVIARSPFYGLLLLLTHVVGVFYCNNDRSRSSSHVGYRIDFGASLGLIPAL